MLRRPHRNESAKNEALRLKNFWRRYINMKVKKQKFNVAIVISIRGL